MAKKLRNPELITLSGDHIGALEIAHFVYLVASDKAGALVRIIEVENPESAIIFCNTRDETERVAQILSRQGFDADWLNGDLPQESREKVMAATREGRLRFLVATDVAARGIDISHLTHVINYDFPQDAESYVHRTGRTGRAGRTGTAISLILPQDIGGLYLLRLTFKIRPLEKQIPSDGELKTRAQANLVAMLAEAFGSRSVHADNLLLARRLLTHEARDVIVAGLLRDHLGARPTASDNASAARRASHPVPIKAADAKPSGNATDSSSPRADGLGARGGFGPVVGPQASDTPDAQHRAKPEMAAQVLPALPSEAARAPQPAAVPASIPALAAGPHPVGSQAVASKAQATSSSASPESAAASERARPTRIETPETRESRDSQQLDERRPRPRAGYEFRRAPMDRRGRPEARSRDELGDSEPLPPHATPPYGTPPRGAAPSSRSLADASVPSKHSDFVTWQPPEEEGDDEPILGYEDSPAARTRQPDRPRSEPDPVPLQDIDLDFVEIYVNVGRREGARAVDIQRLLTERAGLNRSNVRRIRVRERNAFVSVCRNDMARAVAALSGASIGGKIVSAEQARERLFSEGDATEAAAGAVQDAATNAEVAGSESASVVLPADTAPSAVDAAAPDREPRSDESPATGSGSGTAPGA